MRYSLLATMLFSLGVISAPAFASEAVGPEEVKQFCRAAAGDISSFGFHDFKTRFAAMKADFVQGPVFDVFTGPWDRHLKTVKANMATVLTVHLLVVAKTEDCVVSEGRAGLWHATAKMVTSFMGSSNRVDRSDEMQIDIDTSQGTPKIAAVVKWDYSVPTAGWSVPGPALPERS